VKYLGHIFGHDGVCVDMKKIVAMKDWTHPKTLKSLRGFLHLTSYYRNFIGNYGNITSPPTIVLKKMLSVEMTLQTGPSKI
jgi:hypothetical protein